MLVLVVVFEILLTISEFVKLPLNVIKVLTLPYIFETSVDKPETAKFVVVIALVLLVKVFDIPVGN